jgi:CTP synthase
LSKASSEELSKGGPENVIIFMPEGDREKLGATMRLGDRVTEFQPGYEWSKLRQLYGQQKVHERHRHRYEVNPAYIERLTEGGLHFVGKNNDANGERMEVVELKDHPWFVGVQYHPEYLSRVIRPSRPYLGFVAAACGCLDRITKEMGQKWEEGDNQLANGVQKVAI